MLHAILALLLPGLCYCLASSCHDLSLSHCSLMRFLQPSRNLASSLHVRWWAALASVVFGMGLLQPHFSLHSPPTASLYGAIVRSAQQRLAFYCEKEAMVELSRSIAPLHLRKAALHADDWNAGSLPMIAIVFGAVL